MSQIVPVCIRDTSFCSSRCSYARRVVARSAGGTRGNREFPGSRTDESGKIIPCFRGLMGIIPKKKSAVNPWIYSTLLFRDYSHQAPEAWDDFAGLIRATSRELPIPPCAAGRTCYYPPGVRTPAAAKRSITNTDRHYLRHLLPDNRIIFLNNSAPATWPGRCSSWQPGG